MLIIFGKTNLGKVDRVPGLFHVVTEFIHIYYIPFIPIKSSLALDGAGDAAGQRVPIGLSLKSVLMGWLRALLITGALLGALFGVIAALRSLEQRRAVEPESLVIPWLVTAGCLVLFWLTTRFTRASRERALVLAEQIGLDPEYVEECFAPAPERLEKDGSLER